MSSTHRNFLFLQQGLGAGVVNFALSAVIAWLAFGSDSQVPLWGAHSLAADIIGTFFFLPLVSCLIATPLCRRRVRAGVLPALEWTRASHAVLGWLPSGTLARGVVLGAVATLVVAPTTLAVLH